jgi:hypothetical protein
MILETGYREASIVEEVEKGKCKVHPGTGHEGLDE